MKTKRRFFTTIPFLALLLGGLGFLTLAPKASAIQDGQLDGEAHPYVAMVVAYFDFVDGDGVAQKFPLWRGSGTLISPRVVVTAGHVVGLAPDFFGPGGDIAPTSMAVYFESDVRGTGYPLTGGHSGTPMPHPGFNGFLTLPNSHDIGVVLLDEPVLMDEYGQLPALGVLDAMATQRGQQDTTFDVVGYGVQYIRQSPKGIIQLEADPVRYQGVVSLVNLNNALVDGYNMFHTGDEGQGNGSGGTAFGDSGGPVFLPGSKVMVGVTSFGLNMQATGPGAAFRTDTAEAQEFLNGILAEIGE